MIYSHGLFGMIYLQGFLARSICMVYPHTGRGMAVRATWRGFSLSFFDQHPQLPGCTVHAKKTTQSCSVYTTQ